VSIGSKLVCSFCGKDKDDVGKLIAGPAVFICNECIDLCIGLVHSGRVMLSSERREKALSIALAGQPTPDPRTAERAVEAAKIIEQYLTVSAAPVKGIVATGYGCGGGAATPWKAQP
jgi:hypothetical protein